MTPERRREFDKWAKRVSVWLWFVVNALNLWFGFMHQVPQVVVSLVFIASFIPYLVYVRYVSPRLAVNDAADDDQERSQQS